MLQIPYERIIKILVEKSDVSKSEIEERIEGKMQDFSGLISKEGAAHIVANDLGINLHQESKEPVTIGELVDGMRSVIVNVKVLQKYDMVEFNSNGREGKVQSLLVGDATGQTRLTCWHADIEKITDVKADDILQVTQLNTRLNNGNVELHATPATEITKNPQGVSITEVGEQKRQKVEAKRVKLAQLPNAGAMVSVFGVIVQLYRPSFYIADKETARRVKLGDGEEFNPELHEHACVVNVVLDDGSETLRCVCFRNVAEQLLEKTTEALLAMKDDVDAFDTLKTAMLGKQILITGRVTENQMYDRKELIVNSVDLTPDVKAEIAQLEKEL